MNDYMTRRFELKNGIRKPDEKKQPKPIAKRSEKLKEQMKLYKPQVKKFLAKPENRFCKIQMPGCTKKATCVHHAAGRIGEKLMDEKDYIPACIHCNLAVEINDLEAREKGFKKSRHEKAKDTKDSK